MKKSSLIITNVIRNKRYILTIAEKYAYVQKMERDVIARHQGVLPLRFRLCIEDNTSALWVGF